MQDGLDWAWTLRVVWSRHDRVKAPPLVVGGDPVRLGRRVDGASDLEIPDDKRMSRHHATIAQSASGGLMLSDAGSHNGCQVNGTTAMSAALQDGDVVRMGSTILVVRRAPRADPPPAIDGLRGDGVAMAMLRARMHRLARTDTVVLILGEPGTGKGAAAKALHELSMRRGPFVETNLLYQGSATARVGQSAIASDGWIKSADGGTVHIESVGDVPMGAQARLGALVDSHRPGPSRKGVRFVCSAVHDLDGLAAAGKFTVDLARKLSERVIVMPALRERCEDVPRLILRKLHSDQSISAELVEALMLFPWTRNAADVERVVAVLREGSRSEPLQLRALEGRWPPTAPPPPLLVDPPCGPAELQERVRRAGGVAQLAKSLRRTTREVHRWFQRAGLEPVMGPEHSPLDGV